MKKSPSMGILGGGQLARMMLLEAHRMGLNCFVMSSNADDPAAQVTQQWVEGSIDELSQVLEFAKSVDLLTFESEFIKPEILAELSERNICCRPTAKHMRIIQDRLSQKQLLEKYSIPTSPFFKVDQFQNLEKVKESIELPLVLKARLGGYDGKGTFILRDWDSSSITQCKDFLNNCTHGAIAENFIPFTRELAVSVARNENGDIAFFPLVESFQEECRCLWVKGPANHSDIEALKAKLKLLLEKEEYIGFISFELFESDSGLHVNEIAPRVHNSAHYSQNGLSLDQFSCHLMAISGIKLNHPIALSSGFAMYNLIGSGNEEPDLKCEKDVFLHWYGKKENRKGRKMGHLNAVAQSPELALEKLIEARKEIKL
jgi:5-(carboxyamino)imidazole ribonucleotide synthase